MAYSDKDDVAELVIKAVCAVYNVSTQAVASRRRYQQLNDARHTIAYILRGFDYSLRNISVVLNRTDHTTAVHSVKKAAGLIETDPLFRDRYEVAMELITRRPSEPN